VYFGSSFQNFGTDFVLEDVSEMAEEEVGVGLARFGVALQHQRNQFIALLFVFLDEFDEVGDVILDSKFLS